jgi:hypothetical protein
MATSKQLHRLATNPADMMRFQATGQLPSGVRPASPLITLLEQIGARDLPRIVGLTVDERLGYSGSRTFHTAAQALHWLKPAPEVFGSFPAESWRIKAYSQQLSLEDLKACCATFPESLLREHARLLREPQRRSPRP